jgi:hypothetical protein
LNSLIFDRICDITYLMLPSLSSDLNPLPHRTLVHCLVDRETEAVAVVGVRVADDCVQGGEGLVAGERSVEVAVLVVARVTLK